MDGHRWIAHSGGMVGYTAFLAVAPDDGLGVVILQNGDGAKRGVTSYAFSAVRASPSPAPEPPETRGRPRRPRP